MYIRVQHEEFEMIYAPLCFAKSMIISWKLTVGEKIYNVFLDEAIQWMMDERGIEVMARLSKGWGSSRCILLHLRWVIDVINSNSCRFDKIEKLIIRLNESDYNDEGYKINLFQKN